MFSCKHMTISFSFVSGFRNCYLFWRAAIRNAKNAFKIASSPQPGFSTICKAKMKIFAWTFVNLLLVLSSMPYIPIFDVFENLDFIGFISELLKFWIFVAKNQKNKNTRQPFCRTFSFAYIGVFCLPLKSKPHVLEALVNWPFFTQKSVTWHH